MSTRQHILKDITKNFADHQAKLVLDNEHTAIIDWRNKNGTSIYYIRYIIDKTLGSIIIQGDLGFATACWYGKNDLKNFYSFMSDINYFAGKLVCYTDKYTYNEEDIREDIKEAQKYFISEENPSRAQIKKIQKVFKKLTEDIIACREEDKPYTDDIIKTLENYDPDWYENTLIREAGRRLAPRVYYWAYGYTAAYEALFKKGEKQ